MLITRVRVQSLICCVLFRLSSLGFVPLACGIILLSLILSQCATSLQLYSYVQVVKFQAENLDSRIGHPTDRETLSIIITIIIITVVVIISVVVAVLVVVVVAYIIV